MKKKLILVSASPRRKELMKDMGLDFNVNTDTTFIESVPKDIDNPETVPAILAEGKSKGYYRTLEDDEVLISADTVVICDGKILGKPHHREVAVEMLRQLSGKTHKVASAICVRDKERCKVLTDVALVTFRPLSYAEIKYYVEKYNPVDKAGGYGIQEWIGLVGIERIEGSFYTVMGLPTHLLYSLLEEFDAI